MPRALGPIAALILCLNLPISIAEPARAQDGWSDLTRRIAASRPFGAENAALGTEPPGFTFPLNLRPALPLLGSTWVILVPGAQPLSVRAYYSPTPQTTAAVEALTAELTAAGYSHDRGRGFPNGFVDQDEQVHTWCPATPNGPAFAVNVENVDGVPALDVEVYAYASSVSCNSGPYAGPDAGSPIPTLGGIPGLRIFARMRSTESREGSLGSVAVIRTALSPAAALAKLAERFAAKGWTARTPVVDGTATLQHFSRDEASRRWNALLLFEPRAGSDQLYDAVLDVTMEQIGPGGR